MLRRPRFLPNGGFKPHTRDECLRAFVDVLGVPKDWSSGLVRLRMRRERLDPWRAEVGKWLLFAKRHGYLEEWIRSALPQARKARSSLVGEPSPNDKQYLKLQQWLAALRVGDFLERRGWIVRSIEEDVGTWKTDLRLRAPSAGPTVVTEVKSPDQPGEVAAGRIHNGELEPRILEAMFGARDQLTRVHDRATLIAICANRRISLACAPGGIINALMGGTGTKNGRDPLHVVTPQNGVFFRDDWRPVGGVMLLDFRWSPRAGYFCTVVLNPRAHRPLREVWFPGAAVCSIRHGRVRWRGGYPEHALLLPRTPVDLAAAIAAAK